MLTSKVIKLIDRLINGAAVIKRRNANFQHPKLFGKHQLKLYEDATSS